MCDRAITGAAAIRAIGFIKPDEFLARLVLMHVGCENCRRVLAAQYCNDEEELKGWDECGTSVKLGMYRHDEEIEIAHGAGRSTMRMRFRRFPLLSPKLPTSSKTSFSVTIDGDTHDFERLDLNPAPQRLQASAEPAASTDMRWAASSQQGHLLLSGRFNNDEIIAYMRAVKNQLEARNIPVFVVEATVGQSFADLTRIGLLPAKGMVAFCTSEYGAYTGVYSTFDELEFAHDHQLPLFPISD